MNVSLTAGRLFCFKPSSARCSPVYFEDNHNPAHGLVPWSPLVRERGDRLAPMFWPWGSALLLYACNRGGEAVAQPGNSNYWARSIHLDGYRSVAVLSSSALLRPTFAKIRAPVFLGYYCRDENNQNPHLVAFRDVGDVRPAAQSGGFEAQA